MKQNLTPVRKALMLALMSFFMNVSAFAQPACDPAMNACVTQGNNNPINVNLGILCGFLTPSVTIQHDWQVAASCLGWTRVGLLRPIQVPPALTPFTLPSSGFCPDSYIQVNLIALYVRANPAPPPALQFCTITNVDSFFVEDQFNPILALPGSVILDVDSLCTVSLANLVGWMGGGTVADNCTDDATLLANMFVTAGFPVPDLACPTSPNAGTPVTFQTMDACGNLSNTDVVLVQLRDVTEPTITCPPNDTRAFDAVCAYTVEDFTALATPDDACGAPYTLSQRVLSVTNPAAGPFPNNTFPTITGGCDGPRVITIRICAQDCFGNGVLDPAPAGPLPGNCCTFEITVSDQTDPIPGICPPQTDVNVDAGCTANVPDLRNSSIFLDNCQVVDPDNIGMYADLDGDGIHETELFAPGTPVIPGGFFPVAAGDIICNPLFPGGAVDIRFTYIDCNGNPIGGPVVFDCDDLIVLLDVTAPDFIALCPDPAPIFNLDIDPLTCIYTAATVPQDFFNGIAFVNDNCDQDPIEHNDEASFGCGALGFQNIPIWGEDCSGNVSGILGNCQVLIQVNPLDAAWSNPGIVCMSQVPLDLCALLEGTARDCGYWSGDHVEPAAPDNRCNGGTPAMFNPPGPGVYSVTYTVGDANCHVELTRTILVEQDVNPPYLVNDFGICFCPDALIDLESFLLQTAPQGGEWEILSQVPNLGGPVTPGVNILPPTGVGFSHVAKYDGGCLILNLRYTITDCQGNVSSDDIAVTINECPRGSFDLPDDLCQDEGPYAITDTNRVFYGCFDYEVTFDVTQGPSGNLLIGGSPVTGTISTLGPVLVYPDAVMAGSYTIRMTIVDPTGSLFGCPDFVYNQVVNIYKDGASPNGIVPVGPLCEGTTAWPVVLNLQSILDEAGFPMVDEDIRWTGSGVTDNGVTGLFQPADLDGDGWPGPGLFTVCVAVGNPRCLENYCIDILINDDVPDNQNDLVDDFKVCLVPNTFFPYSVLLANGFAPGGIFTGMTDGASIPPFGGILLPNGFFYTGGCGNLLVSYTIPNDCNPDNINNNVVVTICEKPDVEINGPAQLCSRDNKATITSNMVGRLPLCDSTGFWVSYPATTALMGMTDGTAMFDPTVSGEGNFEIVYTLRTGASCSDSDRTIITVSASSDPFFATPSTQCVDGGPVVLSLVNPDPTVQDGNPLNSDGTQEIFWTSSCGGCLTVGADSTQASFNPGAAGPGSHLICVTTGDPSCLQTHCTLIEVRPANNATLVGNLEKGCYDLRLSSACGIYVTDINLADFYLPGTTRGGIWNVVTNHGCRILNETFEASPGCHELTYTVPAAFPGATGACAEMTTTVFLMVTEEPQTDFDLAEQVCWDGIAGSASLPTLYTGATFGINTSNITYLWTANLISGAGPVPTFSDPASPEPEVIIQGAGTFSICLTETLEYEDCEDIVPTSCINEHCEILVVNQTNIEVIPTWNSAGPFCVDDICIDLDTRITGNTGGVFTGNGVELDPSHPNYRFCPAVAGPGTHTICYTVNNGAGCTAVECHNFVVYPAATLSCPDTRDTLQCATMALGPNNNNYGPFNGSVLVSRYTLGTYNLSSMLCPNATQGGLWELISAPPGGGNTGAVAGHTLYYTTPGCYVIRYTVLSGPGLDGACIATQDFFVHIGERPNPSFDLPDAICWDQVSFVGYNIPLNFITSPSYTGVVTRSYRSTNPAVVAVHPVVGTVTVVGNGIASVCMEEIITTNACGAITRCTSEVCQVIRVINNTTVVNPAWGPVDPLCISDGCIDLDDLVTGTPNGIFTGQGVVLGAGGHPNYDFCPALAGVGIHVVTYTVNSLDGCSASFSRNIVVHQGPDASLRADLGTACWDLRYVPGCGTGMINFDLSAFYLPQTTRGGTWSIISAAGGCFFLYNEIYVAQPGCHQLRYTVPSSFPGATGECASMSDTVFLSIWEEPKPEFDLAEEVCWDGIAGSVILPTLYNGETFGNNAAARNYGWFVNVVSGGPAPTFSNAAIQEPTITIQGQGVFEICLNETLVYNSCGSLPGGGSCSRVYCQTLTVHQTTLVADPSWISFGPLCIDDACVDLDARITGDTGGVFTGTGVLLNPSHPNYQFCPATAGAGIHTVCYTVQNGAGCTAVECHNITVYAAVSLACADTRDTVQCATMALGQNANSYGPFNGSTLTSRYTLGTHSLSALLCASATRNGVWSFVSGPAANSGAVANDILYYTSPGCYTVRYSVSSFPGADGACTATQDFTIHVGERPNPSFDFPDDVCWDQVTLLTYNIPVSFLTSPAYTGSVVRNYRSTNPAVASVNAAGLVTVVGNGITTICMEEIITTIACAGVTTRCTSEVCEVLRVNNTLTVANPAWGDPGLICVTAACIDLDDLVTGTPNGVFTGRGVELDPAHPEYRFCPAVAGVGIHAVTYTVNSPDGCTGVMTRNIVVVEQCDATISGNITAWGCYNSAQFRASSFGPRVDFDLSRFYLPQTTRGGVWTIISSPLGTEAIQNETLFGGPGCYTLQYSVSCDPCAPVSSIINFAIIERPTPVFDLAEEACWDGITGSLVLPTYYQGTTWGTGGHTRDYLWTVSTISGPGPVPTLSSGVGVFQAINNPTVTVNGDGVFEICLTERLNLTCPLFATQACTQIYCERITIHQTDEEVDPSWSPIGPFCVDDPCVDLDALITGDTAGVFTGVGVFLDPTHPNYRFCPDESGPGIFSICYTVQNGSGCSATECHNVYVYDEVSLACSDTRDTIQCATKALGPNTNNYGPFNGVLLTSRYTLGSHSLNSLLCATATRGGSWSFVSGPAGGTGTVDDDLLYYTSPGCYTVRYTVSSFPGADGGCLATQDFQVHIGEMPMPMFDLPDHVCWDQVNLVQFNIPVNFLTSPTYSGSIARSYRTTNSSVATVNSSGVVTIVGNGIASICMQETITTNACGLTTTCRAEVCEVIRVLNNTTVVNPAWTAIGPFCIDDPCVRLDVLVTGTTGGIFTGRGVRPPGGLLVHPEYEFCPAVAGVGVHAVTYTVNSPDGCTGVFTRNIEVYPAANATLHSDSIVCQVEPTGIVDLTALFNPLTTGGGVFTLTSGPATGRVIGDNQLNYLEAGCYCFSYTVSTFPGADGACTATGTACLLITEQPTPSFDIQNERCWNITDPVALKRDTLFINSPTYDPAGTRTRVLRVLSGPAIVIANGPTIYAVEYTGAGNVVLCLEETLTYAACGTGIPAGRFCRDTVCRQVSVQDGTAQDARFTVIGAKAEYCPGDTITLIPNVPGGIFTGTNVGNSNPVGTSGGVRFTACGIYVVTYTLETPAGCINQSSQTFFTDRTNPVFVGPTAANRFDTVVNCDGIDQTARMNAWASRFSFTDNCQFRTSFRIYDRRSGCSPSTGLYIYEVLGRDTCGNETRVFPSYRVIDTTRPVIVTPASDLVIECGNETDAQILSWLNLNGRAVANDACSGNILRWSHNFNGDIASYCTTTGNLVTFTVYDQCNNSNTTSARIIVRDLIPPVWNKNPVDLLVECHTSFGRDPYEQVSAWVANVGGGVALDSCQLSVRYTNNFASQPWTGGCNRNTGRKTVTFTAIDGCGNASSRTAVVEIIDITPPEITSPAKDTVVDCDGQGNLGAFATWINNHGGATALDYCSGNLSCAPPANARAAFVTGPGFPWGAGTYTAQMNAAVGAGNWDRLFFASVNPATLFSDTYKFVYLEGGDGNANEFNTFVNTHRALMESWVACGGRLFLNAAPNVGGNIDLGFGGVRILYAPPGTWITNVTQANPHPVFNGPNLPTAINFTGNYYAHALVCPPGMTAILRETSGAQRPILMESLWGDGVVFFGGITATIWHSPALEANNLYTNFLYYLNNVTLPNQEPESDGIMRWDTVRMRTQEDCGGTRTLTYMFTAVDSCGNISNATIARFIIQDTMAPIFLVNPRDTAVNCDRLGNEAALAEWLRLNGRAIATDVCSGPLRWETDLVAELDKCSNTADYVYRFTAFDSCGNSAWREARFIVQDTTRPLIDPASGYDKITSCDQSNAANDDEIIAWLDSMGGLFATDMCSDVINWRHNFSDTRWIDGCGDTRFQDVTFTATDDCGNFSTRTLRVGTVDTTKPVFFNCERPPIVVPAETFHCDAYVNFSPVAAFDNCDVPVIRQIDSTGLGSGSRFPVGTTILVYEASDSCGNRDTCYLKIIVNDYWDLPSITCPDTASFTASLDSCGRTLTVADSIHPRNVRDNCPNTVVTFVVTDEAGQVVRRGFNTAAGTFFPVGVDTITYCVYDQPLLKITEVTQQLGTPIAGGTITIGRTNPVPGFITTDLIDGDYLEIGNYGGGVIDLTCISIEVVGPAGSICDYTIPPPFPLKPVHFLAPGQVATFHIGSGTDVPASRFFHMNCTQAGINDQRAYILRLNDRVIDVVATNGFNPVGRGTIAVVTAADWVGATDPHFCRGSYYRTNHEDNNRSSDFELAESCNAATIGSWNPGNLFSNANLDTVSMQSIVHPPVCCKVAITITDDQAPICGRYDTLTSGIPTNLNVAFNQGVCYSSSVTIPNNCKVGDVRILNMNGFSNQNLGDWEVTLISPSGTRVKLWENVCNASTTFDLNFGTLNNKGMTLTSVNLAPCVPNFGNGQFYTPQESFQKFFNEQGQGTWRIEIEDNSCATTAITNALTNWRLQVLCKAPAVLRDTTITADFRQCRKKFLWYHPLINDNCPGGTSIMTYITTCTNARTGVTDTVLGPITDTVTAGACDSLILPIGVTKISYRIIDMSGNEGMCMFNVTVRDIDAPAIPDYKDVSANASPGECGAFFYFVPDATDSCGIDTIWANPPSGTFFKVGQTRICIYAIDKSGNLDSSCFTLTVNPYIPSSSELACNDKINLSLDATCTAVLTADMILEGGKHWCYDQYEIIVTDSRGIVRSNTFTYADVGKCFRVTIRDPRSGNSCWGEVCIEDKQRPNLACPPDTVVNCISSLDPDILGRAFVTTCEPSATIIYWDEFTELGECALPYVARIVRYWSVEDENGNRDTCEQRIDVERFDLADIRWPRHYDDLDLPHLECDKERSNKDFSAHFLPYQYCVDGYLLDSAIWSATGGFYPSPAGDLAGVRVPKALGWNFLETGPYAGHPSPYPVYYDAHPGWTPQNGFCWGPDEIIQWTGTGFPTVDGVDLFSRGRCAVSIRYEDEVYDICDDSYEILRYWKVRNMCLPPVAGLNPIEYIQVIKVLDSKGPEIVYPDTIVISTTNNSCTAIWDLAEPWMKDNCSDDLRYTVRMRAGRSIQYADGRWAVINIPLGVHEAELTALDGCGNKTIKKIMVSVVDAIIPTPVCRAFTTVNITGNQSPGENYARVYAEAFDEGSYDNCAHHIFFKVIRMAELLGTNNGSNSNNTVACNGRNGDDNLTLAGNQVYFDDYTDFCCADANQRVMVVLRVFDVDPGPGPIAPARMTNRTSNLFGRFNDCMVEVEVQNKNVPTVVAPPNIVVSCWFWFDIAKLTDPNDPTFGRVVTDLSDRKKVVTQDLVCRKYCERNDITGYPGFVPSNQIPKPAPNQACDYYYQYFDTAHWDNKYELTWGFDGYALNSCNVSPTITVNDLRECGQGIIQRIVSATGPNNINVTAIQTIWVVDCDPFYIDDLTCNDPRFSDVIWPNGVCTQTPVTINGCGTDISPDNPQLGRPQVINNADDNCALLSIEYSDDVFTIEPDACLKVLRTWTIIDWCQYDPFIDPDKGRWQRLQVIKVRDQDKPVVSCNVGPCEPASIHPTLGVCVGHISLTASATDQCSPEDWLLWEYKIDAYNDGVGVHAGYDFRVGSLTRRAFNAGDTVEYSHNPFADNPRNPFDASGTYPIGIHKIIWFVEDGCANVGVCETLFEIKDCKAPTPYCHTGIITVPMPTSGCVEIWAKDLDLGSFDNCTSKDNLKFYFDNDATKQSITVCCDDFVNANANDELRIEVEMWVEDEEGNKDYCKTVIIVQDNQNICPDNLNGKARITGLVTDEKGDELNPVEISLYRNGNMMVQRTGNPYLFGDLAKDIEYELRPDRNDEHSNGVSTQDIIRIQKHILSQEAITSPYKLLAADVNNSGSITTADINEIRKLVLGNISEFSKVRSWSFVPTDYVFTDPATPWTAPRTKSVMLDENKAVNFMAFKMGDVTGNAIAGLNGSSQVRTKGFLNLEIDEINLQAGQTYQIEFKSSDFEKINGYQFTFKFDQNALVFDGFESGAIQLNESNFGIQKLAEGLMSTSWNTRDPLTVERDEVLFKLTFRALKAGNVAQMLAVTDDITRAEAYTTSDEVRGVRLGVRTSEGWVESSVFELYQNEPNPFSKQTVVAFRLPEASHVKLTIYDAAGKVIRVYEQEMNKGLNQITIQRSEINAAGVLYYQLDAQTSMGGHTATKRMIIAE
ncbi:MAG: HYR domain-containing protein [Saprospiraceae bacterium]|nr:HYR domain-containing protein [Saprospiraceae bacterium]